MDSDIFFVTLIIIFIGFSLLTAIIAYIKNRSPLKWFLIGSLISPVITFIVILFKSNLDKYDYTLNQSSNKVIVTEKSPYLGLIIFFIAVLGVISIVLIVNVAEKIIIENNIDPKSLVSRNDVSEYTADGELAKAFKPYSKYTYNQRKELLKKIKDKLVIWEVVVSEITRNHDSYLIQSSNITDSTKKDLDLKINVYSLTDDETIFLNKLKIGDKVKFKGVLTGSRSLFGFGSLEINPAILWYPNQETIRDDVSSSAVPENPIKNNDNETTRDDVSSTAVPENPTKTDNSIEIIAKENKIWNSIVDVDQLTGNKTLKLIHSSSLKSQNHPNGGIEFMVTCKPINESFYLYDLKHTLTGTVPLLTTTLYGGIKLLVKEDYYSIQRVITVDDAVVNKTFSRSENYANVFETPLDYGVAKKITDDYRDIINTNREIDRKKLIIYAKEAIKKEYLKKLEVKFNDGNFYIVNFDKVFHDFNEKCFDKLELVAK